MGPRREGMRLSRPGPWANQEITMTATLLKMRLLAMLSASSILFFAGITLPGTGNATEEIYDVVVLHGRVIDPESNLDALRNIGIRSGKIQTITTKSLKGRTVIDATGLVVS